MCRILIENSCERYMFWSMSLSKSINCLLTGRSKVWEQFHMNQILNYIVVTLSIYWIWLYHGWMQPLGEGGGGGLAYEHDDGERKWLTTHGCNCIKWSAEACRLYMLLWFYSLRSIFWLFYRYVAFALCLVRV